MIVCGFSLLAKQFIYRVSSLWLQLGVSSVIVVGGCGDYFDVHDTAILVDNYTLSDATERGHSVSDQPRTPTFMRSFSEGYAKDDTLSAWLYATTFACVCQSCMLPLPTCPGPSPPPPPAARLMADPLPQNFESRRNRTRYRDDFASAASSTPGGDLSTACPGRKLLRLEP